MNHTTFTVTRFINRNGTVSWRVCGSLHGIRIRKNFRSREEAGAEKAALETKALQNASGLRASATFLTDDQLREAEVAFRKLAERPRSLMVYLDYALANYREPEREVPLAVAVAEYVATKQKDLERTLLSIRQFRSIKNELDLFKNRFPDALVSEFSPPQLVAYLERGEASLKTYNNRRGILSTFFKFAGQHHQATLRALAFKWIRILWRCWQDRVPYDEKRYLASLRQRKSPLATALAAT